MSKKAVIFSAPSGSGKTTIVRHLLSKFPALTFSISATTRKPRAGEQDGRDYFFLSNDEFNRAVNENRFVEYEQVYVGTYYGTLRSEVERIWAEDKVVIFDVDVVGGTNLKKYFGEDALAVFIRPPSLDALRERLVARGTDSQESIEKRLAKAGEEMVYESNFDVTIINEVLESSYDKAEAIVREFIQK